ncbi:MAG: serine/threonine dehydratase [Roseiflexus castenholzii]|nr:MAG: serine/threonine dehydratase [Roseiflexus castenholzii]
MNDMLHEILRAARRLRRALRPTPLEESIRLGALTDGRALLKLENTQPTGSFKVRGALNVLLSLPSHVRERGVVAASSGNHGTAVAYSALRLGAPALIFVPEDTSPVKVNAMRDFGADVRVYGDDCVVTETYARSYATDHGLTYISPYNDPLVIGGQGTIGVELARQIDRLDAILVAVGGGLISGIAAYMKAVQPDVRIIGCSPIHSPAMYESVLAGEVVSPPVLPTLSDGTAGGVEPGAITLDLCHALVDEWVLVSEVEIAAAMRLMIETQHTLVEGSAGVAVAGYLRLKEEMRGKTAAIIICGGNVSLATLRAVIDMHV